MTILRKIKIDPFQLKLLINIDDISNMNTPLETIVNEIRLVRTQPAMTAAMLEAMLEEKKINVANHQTQKVDTVEPKPQNTGNLIDILG